MADFTAMRWAEILSSKGALLGVSKVKESGQPFLTM